MLKVHILVHLKTDVLDVQGQAIQQALKKAGHGSVAGVQMGKSFYADFDYPDEESAREEIERVCCETLSNPTIEDYTWKVIDQ